MRDQESAELSPHFGRLLNRDAWRQELVKAVEIRVLREFDAFQKETVHQAGPQGFT